MLKGMGLWRPFITTLDSVFDSVFDGLFDVTPNKAFNIALSYERNSSFSHMLNIFGNFRSISGKYLHFFIGFTKLVACYSVTSIHMFLVFGNY